MIWIVATTGIVIAAIAMATFSYLMVLRGLEKEAFNR
jgi:hypothetical protein